MFDFLFGRKLEDVLNVTKTVKISGVKFVIKKINVLNYIEGTSVMMQSYDTHKTDSAKSNVAVSSQAKIKQHMVDVILGGVVSPKLYRTKEESEKENGIYIENIFNDWDLVNDLYTEIMVMTYGKKKIKQATSLAKS